MAINWTRYDANGKVETTRTSHEGLVLSGAQRRFIQIMSDVWESESFCLVWDEAKGKAVDVSLCIHFSQEFKSTEVGRCSKDAHQDLLDAHEANEAAEKAAEEAAERAHDAQVRQEREMLDWHRPENGKVMQVVRGRKVKKGTIGKVFWVDNFRNPSRAGLALTQRKNAKGFYQDVAWVSAEYLQNMKVHPEYEVA